jgi:methionyl-tRNA formyltransferase
MTSSLYPISVVFMGTPEFAVPCLQELYQAGYEVRAVYTQPPRPKGRGYLLQKSPVHQCAEALGLLVKNPTRLKGEVIQDLKDLKPALILVAAYGLILPQEVLDIPSLGCVNVHASLLPRWRGAAPLQHALLSGDTHTGTTLMQMDAGMDTGPILAQEPLKISSQETTASLTEKLATQGARFLINTLPRYLKGEIEAIPQPSEGVCYAPKIGRLDGEIHWDRSALIIERQVRALKAWFQFKGRRLRLEAAEVVPLPKEAYSDAPGTLFTEDPLAIICGETSALRPVRLTPEGGMSMAWDAFLRGSEVLKAGICLP